ncbi:hypothetical protein FKW77_005022 [Venturia effusa]|uniref:Uncharacterized protein n=1 Tax=Venturia effusa TaxID=50376 RepID=A0A517LH68_9PEZI|nr:hypothetical protein FKW77_005022 [Venturia effusa]
MALTKTKQHLSSISKAIKAPFKFCLSKLKTRLRSSKKPKTPRISTPIPLTTMYNVESEKMAPPISPPASVAPSDDTIIHHEVSLQTTPSRPASEPMLFDMDDDLEQVGEGESVIVEEVPRHSISNIKWGPSRVEGVV